ncbi:MAG: thioredoxin family protein [Bacteroidota bacterium]
MKKITFLLTALTALIVLNSFRLPSDGYQVGDKVADFKLTNVDGKTVSLADNQAAKGYIVVFTCNTCPVAQAYEDRIIALNQKYAAKGYPVIAINPNDPTIAAGDSFEKMKQRATSKQYAFPYLVDENQQVAKAYGARSTPHVFIVTRTGNDFTVAYIGAIDNNSEDEAAASKKFVEAAMEDILAGKPASVNFTKAVGCSIKWKKA